MAQKRHLQTSVILKYFIQRGMFRYTATENYHNNIFNGTVNTISCLQTPNIITGATNNPIDNICQYS